MSTSASPTTTGDTANGRSMSVTSAVRPGNRNRAIAHAAAMPNTVFSATAAGATTSVSRTAAPVSEFHRFAQYSPGPLANASTNTLTTGTITSTVNVISASAVSDQRTQTGSREG